ncbi:MAG: AEC family transporter [Bauldia sp.]|nr:AEC family transporter [Bauldia sp.]
MSQTLAIVLPVFGLIALGFALARTGLLKDQVGESLADFVFIVAIPVLIFRTLAEADFTGAAPWRIWLPFFATFGLMWILGDWLVRRLFGRDARAGLVAGISAAYGNTVLVGIPLALAAFGDAGAVPIALIIAIHLPVMMGASAILIERAERLDGVTEAPRSAAVMARSVLANLGRNPIVIGIVLGAAWRLTGIPLGGVAGILVNRLAEVAATLALFAMGMSLKKYGIRGNIRAGVVLSVLKLLVMPALAFVLARYVVPMPPVWAKVMVLTAACPTGVNAYLVAARFRTGEALASNAITISTGFAVVTTALWLTLVEMT